jgi:hypothetical protein
MAAIGHPELGVVESSHAKLFEAIQLVGQKKRGVSEGQRRTLGDAF